MQQERMHMHQGLIDHKQKIESIWGNSMLVDDGLMNHKYAIQSMQKQIAQLECDQFKMMRLIMQLEKQVESLVHKTRDSPSEI